MKIIEVYTHRNEVGVLLEIESTRDVGISKELIREIASDLTIHIAGCNPENIDSLLAQGFIKNPEISVSQWLSQLGASEVKVNRFVRYGG